MGTSVDEGSDLNLQPEQRVALLAIQTLSLAMGAFKGKFGRGLQATMGPILADAANAALASTKCPFDHPPEDIIQDFDPKKNIYLHCLHGNRHCWSMSGHYIRCPR